MLTFDKHDSNSLVSGKFFCLVFFYICFRKETIVWFTNCVTHSSIEIHAMWLDSSFQFCVALYRKEFKLVALCISGNLAPFCHFWVKVLSWCLKLYFWSLIEIKSWTLGLAWILKSPVWRQWREFCRWHNSTCVSKTRLFYGMIDQ